MAYGTPNDESEIEDYYTDIRHGKRQVMLNFRI